MQMFDFEERKVNVIMFPKVILIDINYDIIKEWEKYFIIDKQNVEIVHMDFKEYMKTNGESVSAITTPGNAMGLMDGGFDKLVVEHFGKEVENKIQSIITEKFFGEQTVGTAFSITIPGTEKLLIHCPSMRVPGPIKDDNVVYNCMRSTLIEAIRAKAKNVLIPAFGGLTGRVAPDIIARKMWGAYVQVKMPHYKIGGWDTVIDYTDEKLWKALRDSLNI